MMLAVCNILVIGLGSALAFVLLSRTPSQWPWRREIQLFVLIAPLIGLLFGLQSLRNVQACIGGIANSTGLAQGMCASGGALFSEQVAALDGLMTLGMAALVIGAIALGSLRHLLLVRFMRQITLAAPSDLQALAGRLAIRLGVTQPHLRLRVSDQPLALTYGLCRPKLVLSTWMVERFDRDELEAVLAHELAHIARRDYLVVWLATMCRDAFCYLPTSWIALKQLRSEKEVACDDLAIGVTHSSLGLASALAKVWQQAIVAPAPSMAQSLAEASNVIEGRITRLLETSQATTSHRSTQMRPFRGQIAAVVGLLCFGTLLAGAILTAMGCGLV
jgi:beta-lactamase regulating signal transducer with metallopeptidase domain